MDDKTLKAIAYRFRFPHYDGVWTGWINGPPGKLPTCDGVDAEVQLAYGTPAHGKEPWQPIETAPKDGTPILCAERYYVFIAKWTRGRWDDHREDPRGDGPPAAPTHWQPLPFAPPC